jgi:hypothetical protein
LLLQVGSGTPAIAGGSEMWGTVRTSETPSPQSPTPSPAGSVGSVGSQSSGYSSGELARPSGQPGVNAPAPPSQPPAANMGPCVAIPLGVHSAMQKQNQHFIYLQSCHDLWDQADSLIHKGKSIGKYLIIHFLLYSSLTKTDKLLTKDIT